jgi:hypothetical protein
VRGAVDKGEMKSTIQDTQKSEPRLWVEEWVMEWVTLDGTIIEVKEGTWHRMARFGVPLHPTYARDVLKDLKRIHPSRKFRLVEEALDELDIEILPMPAIPDSVWAVLKESQERAERASGVNTL